MIPRILTCWYCERGQHAKCFSARLCACRTCSTAHREEVIADISFQMNLHPRACIHEPDADHILCLDCGEKLETLK